MMIVGAARLRYALVLGVPQDLAGCALRASGRFVMPFGLRHCGRWEMARSDSPRVLQRCAAGVAGGALPPTIGVCVPQEDVCLRAICQIVHAANRVHSATLLPLSLTLAIFHIILTNGFRVHI